MDFFLFGNNGSKPTSAQPKHVTYEDIRPGTLVQIIRKPKSALNIYKGYIGEIKHFRKGQTQAIILLYAMAYPKCIKFPIDHFEKIP